ncbi:zinc ribbon domain-containing protein [Vibrio algivorus]|uniref:Zinc ribbon domain-containing protein n=1 Tax=Vibrio algivorus TaxID=1667024 RepID=A0A557P9P3_9VIBR|nr:zinc ribbon domain-containing protein [Vibrio algivorus]TVO37374.1 zinc ribbon domain-containing protein [Vibrio algivorus]
MIFVWVILSIIVGSLATKYGRSGFGFFVLSLLLSPLVGGIVLIIAGRTIQNELEREAIKEKVRKHIYQKVQEEHFKEKASEQQQNENAKSWADN